MNLFHVLLLAAVQGLTEFLPVSSSGHLVIAEALLGEGDPGGNAQLALNVVLHAGTLLAVLVVYWRRVWRLLGADRRVLGLLAVGTLPAAAAGLAIKFYYPDLVNNALLAGVMLMVTGVMLLWAGRRRTPGETDYADLTYGGALVIGLVQALAILPGISRSGSTIVAGLAVGLRREAAATFSFLLAIPVIGGAAVLQGTELVRGGFDGLRPALLAAGVAASFAVGLVALLWLLAWLRRGRLHYFAWWCIPLGAAVVVWQLWV